MTTTFSGPSRLSNLRQKKNSLHEDPLNSQGDFKLTLPDNDDKAGYQPSQTNSNTRTSMRLLKGKIDRGQSSDKLEIKSNNTLETQPSTQQRLTLLDSKEDMKLVLHDSPQINEKKAVQQVSSKPPQKRIMIAKQTSKDEPIVQPPPPPPTKQEEPAKIQKSSSVKQQSKPQKHQYVNPHDEKPIIKEQQVEESQQQPQNQNDLVLCPQGCGRKFNRKALQKHAKACKIVFMSKRKQFNSQAKRITTKQQANLVKQNKQKEKTNLGKTKTKGFQKTSDNWKAASEDFRAAIKAIKKDQDEPQQDNQNQQNAEGENNAALNLVSCQYCEKMFAQVLIQKHLENCVRKKQKEKEKKKPGVTKKK